MTPYFRVSELTVLKKPKGEFNFDIQIVNFSCKQIVKSMNLNKIISIQDSVSMAVFGRVKSSKRGDSIFVGIIFLSLKNVLRYLMTIITNNNKVFAKLVSSGRHKNN